MKGPLAAVLLLAALLLPAGAPAGTVQEIAHLLQFIEQSGCIFTRNGAAHGSAEAREHIGKKYDYVRGRVRTAEDFIEYAATKSSITGKPYLVRCGEREMAAAEWLRDELGSFRLGKATAPSRDERSAP